MATRTTRWMMVLALATSTAQAAPPSDTAELERQFWHCDHAATQGRLDGASAMACSVATEAFKTRRFGGDFMAMLAWWRANKDEQHLALSMATARGLASAADR